MCCNQDDRAAFKTRWYNDTMNIRRVSERSKRDYLQLLLLADEQEDMIDRYLGRGAMFALDIAGKTVGVCVVTDEGDRVLEIKNLAVDPAYQRRGLGRALIEFIARNAKGTYDTLQVGTGGQPAHGALLRSMRFRVSPPHREFLHRQLRPPDRGGRRSAQRYGLPAAELVKRWREAEGARLLQGACIKRSPQLP